MGEGEIVDEARQSSALLKVIQSYFERLLEPTPIDHTNLELEQKVLSEGVELLETARRSNDQPAVDYLSSLLKTHIAKGQSYTQAYQSAVTALNPVQEETAEVEDTSKKRKNTTYPELSDAEISSIVQEYKSNPKEWYSERELVAVLKYHGKLPNLNVFKLQVKAQKLISSRIRHRQPSEYERSSIENFLEVIGEYVFVDNNFRDSIASRLKVVNWKVYGCLEHSSLADHVKKLSDLFDISSKKTVWLYKADSYEQIIKLMSGLVGKESNINAVQKQPKPKKPRKPKDNNGNGALLDWAGVEKYFDVKPGVIVGTDMQDRIEDILGSPEVPKDGSPGYPESLLVSKRAQILKIINA